jgi:putative transposase
MVKAYSRDLRDRVIASVEEDGMSCREAARHYRISAASAVKWLQGYRMTGRREARPMGGDRRSVLPPERDWLLGVIKAEPEVTLVALCARLAAERGVLADASMLCRFFKAAGISFKKKRIRSRAGTT